MLSKATVNWLFHYICYLAIACFDYKIDIFHQTVVRVYYILKGNKKSENEPRSMKDIICTAIDNKTVVHNLLDKHDYWKLLGITTWVRPSITNCKSKTNLSGPLATDETNKSIKFITNRAEKQFSTSEKFGTDQHALNLQENTDGILE